MALKSTFVIFLLLQILQWHQLEKKHVFFNPIAPGISDSEKTREKYFEIIIKRLEKLTNQSIKDFILFKESSR